MNTKEMNSVLCNPTPEMTAAREEFCNSTTEYLNKIATLLGCSEKLESGEPLHDNLAARVAVSFAVRTLIGLAVRMAFGAAIGAVPGFRRVTDTEIETLTSYLRVVVLDEIYLVHLNNNAAADARKDN